MCIAHVWIRYTCAVFFSVYLLVLLGYGEGKSKKFYKIFIFVLLSIRNIVWYCYCVRVCVPNFNAISFFFLFLHSCCDCSFSYCPHFSRLEFNALLIVLSIYCWCYILFLLIFVFFFYSRSIACLHVAIPKHGKFDVFPIQCKIRWEGDVQNFSFLPPNIGRKIVWIALFHPVS